MTLGRRRIPRWANMACWVWIGLLVGRVLYLSRVQQLDLAPTVGFFWISLPHIAYLSVAGAIVLYVLVLAVDLTRGRQPKEEEPAKLDSDVGNLVP